MPEQEKVKQLQLLKEKSNKRIKCQRKKSKLKKKLSSSVAHIISSFNNTIITITDEKGNTLAWSSSGHRF